MSANLGSDVLTRYDAKDTPFYLDPPYYGHENDYGEGLFAKTDYAALASKLTSLKGKFLLSINDTPKMRACLEKHGLLHHANALHHANPLHHANALYPRLARCGWIKKGTRIALQQL